MGQVLALCVIHGFRGTLRSVARAFHIRAWIRTVGIAARRAGDIMQLAGLAAWRGSQGFYNRDNLTYAASVAYYALLSLFPVFLLGMAIIGRVTADIETRDAVVSFVLRYFPTQFDFITDQLEAFRANQVTFGLTGTIALLWGALGVFGALTTAVNYAWGVEQQPTFWRHKVVSFLMMLVAGGLLLLALFLVTATQLVRSTWFARVLTRFPGLALLHGFTVEHATTLLFIFVVGLVYYFIPNAKVRFRDVWLGALVTGLLWKGALAGFTWFVRDVSRFTRVNGSIATVVVFLMWVYTQAVILLYGVEFTAAYARLRRGRSEEAPAAPSPRA